MLVNVLSWRRVHYWHPFVNVFKDNRWTWKMYVCIYVQQYAYACVWNVGLMYVHVYVTAPQSKWSSPHFIWWHHRANEGSLFMPSSHLRWWLHRTTQSKWKFIVYAIAILHMMAPEQMKVHCSCHHLTSHDGSTEQMKVHCSCHCHTSSLAFRHSSSKFITGYTTEGAVLISEHLSADIAYTGLMVSVPSVKFAKSCEYQNCWSNIALKNRNIGHIHPG